MGANDGTAGEGGYNSETKLSAYALPGGVICICTSRNIADLHICKTHRHCRRI